MATMIQIRNVPDSIHRRLKARAAMAGKTLWDYLLQELREVASRPTLEDMRARLESPPIATLPVAPTEAVRRERDDR